MVKVRVGVLACKVGAKAERAGARPALAVHFRDLEESPDPLLDNGERDGTRTHDPLIKSQVKLHDST
jgi:hypothetical protein